MRAYNNSQKRKESSTPSPVSSPHGRGIVRYNPPIAVLPIIIGNGTAILRTKAQEVPRVTKDVLRLLRDMTDTMKAAEGVGLAAPQIGQSLRLCIALLQGKVIAFINPRIIWRSQEEETAEEGCLSLPNVFVPVPRSHAITVRFWNRQGKEEERKLEDLPARILQHEIDHLDGILITDYVPQTHVKS